ncbi:MAG: hypothetical protein H6Q75_497 [Firmicutes bacterium]|nr:hypothetical protein [Bacillota bacterium]
MIFSGYSKEVRQLNAQLPKCDRDAIMRMYKKLPKQAKADFAKALHNADTTAAGHILGTDLTKYNLKIDSPIAKAQIKKQHPVNVQPGRENGAPMVAKENIVTRVNRILAVPTSIDPEMVAEAARRYENAVPTISPAVNKLGKSNEYRG